MNYKGFDSAAWRRSGIVAIGMPIIGVALFTVMGFAIKRTIQYKRIKRNNEKNERKCQKEDV